MTTHHDSSRIIITTGQPVSLRVDNSNLQPLKMSKQKKEKKRGHDTGTQ